MLKKIFKKYINEFFFIDFKRRGWIKIPMKVFVAFTCLILILISTVLILSILNLAKANENKSINLNLNLI